MGNRCPRCGSYNTRKSDERLLKGGLSFLGDIALGFGLGKLGLGDFAEENAEDITLSQFVEDEFQCRDCGYVWKPGQNHTHAPQNRYQGGGSQPKKKKQQQSYSQKQIGNTSIPSYSRRELVDIIAQCEGLGPGICNESTLLTTDKNVILRRLQSTYGIQLSKSQINRVNTYKGLVNLILECGSSCQKIETSVPIFQEQIDDDFVTDWDVFWDNIDSYLNNRYSLENEYNSICRKAKKHIYDDPNMAASYYYMASVLCYLFRDDENKFGDDRDYAFELGKTAINSAKQLLQESEELNTFSLVYEMMDLAKKEHDVYKGFQKIQTIKNTCPHIETLSNTLITTEALKEWFDRAYYDFIFGMMIEEGESLEKDIDLKAKYAMALTNSPEEFLRLFGHTYLSDALYDGGKYNESKRYAKLGMDILGVLTEYDHEAMENRLWGMCFTIYARSQEKIGDLKDALELYEQGATLGIPWCQKDIERLKPKDSDSASSVPLTTAENANNKQFSKPEQEYLELLKESFEGGEITPRERKMLDRIRISLGISEERAKELEATLSAPHLTDEEKEYLEALKEACEDGEISDKQRRLLEKLRVMYGISEERSRELEKM